MLFPYVALAFSALRFAFVRFGSRSSIGRQGETSQIGTISGVNTLKEMSLIFPTMGTQRAFGGM